VKDTACLEYIHLECQFQNALRERDSALQLVSTHHQRWKSLTKELNATKVDEDEQDVYHTTGPDHKIHSHQDSIVRKMQRHRTATRSNQAARQIQAEIRGCLGHQDDDDEVWDKVVAVVQDQVSGLVTELEGELAELRKELRQERVSRVAAEKASDKLLSELSPPSSSATPFISQTTPMEQEDRSIYRQNFILAAKMKSVAESLGQKEQQIIDKIAQP